MTHQDPEAILDLLPFARFAGIEMVELSPQLVRCSLEWSPERCTAGGIVHGGALMTLADTCGGICAFLNLPDGASGTATIESKSNFLRGVGGGSVVASARPLHVGRTTMVVETEIERDDGALAAKVTQTQAFQFPR